MKIDFYHNACLKITARDFTLLCDPWFYPAYYGTWEPVVTYDDPIKAVGYASHIWISHIHPDHYDPKFLREYQEEYDAPIIADSHVRNDRTGLRFYHGTLPGVTVVQSKIYPIDHALIVKERGKTVVNLNDVLFDEDTAKEIKDTAGDIDIALVPFNGAGPYPQCWHDPDMAMEEKDKRLSEMRARSRQWISTLKPKEAYLIAGEYDLVGPLAGLNPLRAVESRYRAADAIGAKVLEREPGYRHPPAIRAHAEYDWMQRPMPSRKDLAKAYESAKATSLARDSYTFHCGDIQFGNGKIDIFIDPRLFHGLLEGKYHWGDAQIGSCFFARRQGAFNREVMDSLETFTR